MLTELSYIYTDLELNLKDFFLSFKVFREQTFSLSGMVGYQWYVDDLK